MISRKGVHLHVVVVKTPLRVLDPGVSEPKWCTGGETQTAATTNGLSDVRSEILVVGVQLLELNKLYENGPRTLQNRVSATPCVAPGQPMALAPTTWLALREKRELKVQLLLP